MPFNMPLIGWIAAITAAVLAGAAVGWWVVNRRSEERSCRERVLVQV